MASAFVGVPRRRRCWSSSPPTCARCSAPPRASGASCRRSSSPAPSIMAVGLHDRRDDQHRARRGCRRHRARLRCRRCRPSGTTTSCRSLSGRSCSSSPPASRSSSHGALPKWLGWIAILFGVRRCHAGLLRRLARRRALDPGRQHHAGDAGSASVTCRPQPGVSLRHRRRPGRGTVRRSPIGGRRSCPQNTGSPCSTLVA